MSMENKMYAKPQYKCAICETIYDELKDRVNCETKCIKKQEEEAKKAAELKKKAEHDAREADVDAKVKAAIEAITAYTKDYGFYTYANEKDILTIGYTVDSNIAYFDQWSDQNAESTREIIVGGKAEQEYKAIFRSNKIFVNKKGVQGVYQNTQQIYPNIVVGIPT